MTLLNILSSINKDIIIIIITLGFLSYIYDISVLKQVFAYFHIRILNSTAEIPVTVHLRELETLVCFRHFGQERPFCDSSTPNHL